MLTNKQQKTVVLGKNLEEALNRMNELMSKRQWKRVLAAYYILLILQQGESYGNEIVRKVEKLTNGVYQPNPNELYPVLSRLESWNIIEGSWSIEKRSRKRVYRMGEDGEFALGVLQNRLKEWIQQLQIFVDTIRKDIEKPLKTKK